MAIFIKDKIDFKSNTVTWDKKGYYIMIKDTKDIYIYIYLPIHQKDITIINMYVPNIRAHKYTKQMLTILKN